MTELRLEMVAGVDSVLALDRKAELAEEAAFGEDGLGLPIKVSAT